MYRFLSAALALTLFACGDNGDDGPTDKDTDPPVATDVDDFHDPLSMPEEPTLSASSFNSAETCKECHPTHYEEWSQSMHAYSMVDPVYRELVYVRQADFDGTEDQFCTMCHSAIGTRSGDIVDNFSFDSLLPITLEGITCEACHKVESVERAYNSGHVIDEDGPLRGPISDPANNVFHDSEYSEVFDDSVFCAGCHDVVESSDLNLERPYEEWLESPAAEEGRNCQSCHMPTYEGVAADGAPTRTLHEHSWVGVDVPLDLDFASLDEREATREKVVELLDGVCTVLIEVPDEVTLGEQMDIVVTVRNELDAHNLPTGSTFIRQMWLEVVATDAAGTQLYETGLLDDNGDLRNYYSELDQYGDQDLVTYTSGFVDDFGNPELFPWRAAEHYPLSIPPLYDRTNTLFIPTDDAVEGTMTITARVRFRTHPPYLLRALGLDHLIEDLEIYDLDANEVSVEVVP